MKRIGCFFAAILAVCLSAICGVLPVQAQTYLYWTNGVNNSTQFWSGANWTNGTPQNGGSNTYILVFDATNLTGQVNDALMASNDFSTVPFAVNGLWSIGKTSQVTLAGGQLMLTNNGATGPTISNSSAAVFYINNNLLLANNTTVGMANSIVISGLISGNGGLTLVGGAGLQLNSGNTYTGGTTNTGSGMLRMGADNVFGTANVVLNGSGSGISALSGNRTFTNALFINTNVYFGELTTYTNNITNSGVVNLGAGLRTLTLQSTNMSVVLNGSIQNGGLTEAGLGTLVLGGTNTFLNGVVVNGGAVLQVNSAAALGGYGSAVTNLANVTDNGTVTFNYSGIQSSLSRLAPASTGTVGLNTNNLSDVINFNTAGLTNVFLGAAAGTITNNLANYIPYVNTGSGYASNQWNLGGGNGILMVTNSISGSDSVVIGGNGLGTVYLLGSNTYTGSTTIQGSQFLALITSNALRNTSTIYLNSGSLGLSNAVIYSPLVIAGGAVAPNPPEWGTLAQQLDFAGSSTNIIYGQILLTGSATARTLTGSGGQIIISGGIVSSNNSSFNYYGSTPFIITNTPVNLGSGSLGGNTIYINVGSNNVGMVNPAWGGSGNRIVLGVNNAFTNVPSLSIGGSGGNIGVMDLNGFNFMVSSITSDASTTGFYQDWVTNSSANAATLTVSNNNITAFNGTLAGAQLGLTKTSTGTLTLNGTNTYLGNTVINGGTLIVAPVAGLSNSTAIAINSGALLLGSSNSVGNQSISVGAAGSIGTTYALDQNTLNWLAARGSLTMNGAVGLGANDANSLIFSNNWYLGGSGPNNVTMSGAAVWTSGANMYLGGGDGTLIYTPVIGAGTNLYVGPNGGNTGSVVVLTGVNALNGTVAVQSGMLKVTNDVNLGAAATPIILENGGGLGATSNNVALNSSRNISLYSSGTLGADSNTALGVLGTVSDNGSWGTGTVLQVVGPGTVILGGSNTYSGGTVLQGGTLNISNDLALGTADGATLGLGGTPLAFSNNVGTLQISGTWTNNNRAITLYTNGIFSVDVGQGFTVTNAITGAGGLTKIGAGTQFLGAVNSYLGTTTISNGVLQLTGGANTLATNGAITAAGGVLDLGGNVQYTTNQVTLVSGALQNGTLSNSLQNFQVQSGTNSANLAGAVALVKSTAGTVVLMGQSTYSGGTSNTAGVLALGANNALGSGVLIMGGGSLAVANGGNVTETNVVNLLVNSTVDTTGGNLALNGPVNSAAYVLTKNGANTLTLGGNDIVSNTVINAGTLLNTGTLTSYNTNGIGLQVTFASVLTNSGAINIVGLGQGQAKMQIYSNAVVNNAGAITNIGGGAIVLAESIGSGAATNAGVVFNNYTNGTVYMNGGTFYLGIYYTGTYNNVGGATTLTNAALLIGATGGAGGLLSNQLATLNINSGLFADYGSGGFTLGGSGTGTNATGIINLNGGTLATAKNIAQGVPTQTNGAVGSTGIFNFAGGTLSGTVNGVTLLGTDLTQVNVETNGAVVAIAPGITDTISANLRNGGGNGGLTMQGPGTLILSGSNVFTGGTVVNGGILQYNSTNALGAWASGQNITNNSGAVAFNFAGFMYAATNRVGQANGGTLAQTPLNATEIIVLTNAQFAGAFLGAANGVVTNAGYTPYINTANGAGSNLWALGGGGGTLVMTNNFNNSADGVVVGGGGGGVVVLAGTNTYTGGTLLLNGGGTELSIASYSNLPSAGAVTFNGGTLQITGTTINNLNAYSNLNWSTFNGGLDVATNANNLTVTNAIGGTGGLAKLGAGTLTLSGANSFSGGLLVSSGTVAVSGSGTLGQTNNAVTMNGVGALLNLGGTIQTNGLLSVGNGAVSNGTFLVSGISLTNGTIYANLSNAPTTTAQLSMVGTGNVAVLAGTNTYTGGTLITAGELSISAYSNLPTTGTLMLTNGGVLQVTGTTVTNLNPYTLNTSTFNGGFDINNAANTVTVGSALSGAGTLTKLGAGTLQLTANNTETGGTLVSAGTLLLGGSGTLGATNGTVWVNGSTAVLNLGGTTQTSGALGLNAGIVTNGTLMANVYNLSNGTIYATLANAPGAATPLIMAGSTGSVTLAGANTYSGGTMVMGGYYTNNPILNIANSAALGSGSVLLTNGGNLTLSGNITVTNAITTSGGDGWYNAAASGAGQQWNGTLRNISGTNRVTGLITVLGSVNIGSDAGVFYISGGITNGGVELSASGAGNSLIVDTKPITIGGNQLSIHNGNTNVLNVAGNVYGTVSLVYGGNLSLGVNNALAPTGNLQLNNGGGGDTSPNFLYLNGTTQTVANLSILSSNISSLETINIGSGMLTVNGNIQVGPTASNTITRSVITGAGTLVQNNLNGTLLIGNNNNAPYVGAVGNSATNDMSTLGTFIANLGAAGRITVGSTNTAANSGAAGISGDASLFLLATNSTLTAGYINLGDADYYTATQTMLLGAGQNVLNVNTVNVGSAISGRSSGVLQFNGATGTLSISNVMGGRADMLLGGTSTQLGSLDAGTVNLAGHASTLYLGNLMLASEQAAQAGTNSIPIRTASFTFDTGTLDVTNVVMASRSSNWSTNGTPYSLATLSIGGGTSTIGQIIMATNMLTGNAVTGIVNLTGGSITVSNGITRGLGGLATNGQAVVSLSGSNTVLNMNGSAIGGAGTNFWVTLNMTNGTLMNLSEYNGGSTLIKAGAQSLLILSGTNTYTGGTVIQNGTLQFNSTNAMGATSGGQNITNLGGAVAFNFAGISNVVVSRLAPISTGSLALTTNNAADVVNFNTANLSALFLGADAGQVVTNNSAGFTPYVNTGSSASNLWQLGGGGGTLVLTNAMTGGDGVVIGGGGGGVVVLAGTNTYTGGTLLQYGGGMELSIGSYSNLPVGGTLTITGGTLQVTGTQITNLNPYTINWSTFTGGLDVANSANTLTVSNAIGGSGSLTKLGAGILALAGTNTYTGNTIISGGELSISSYSNLPTTSSTLIFTNGGVLQITGTAVTNLSPYNLNATTFNGGFDVNATNNTLTISNNLSGTGSLTKYGGGTLVISGSNTLTGGDSIYAGVLKQGSSNDFNGSTVTVVQTGAALDIGGVTNGPYINIVVSGSGVGPNTGAVFNSGANVVNVGIQNLTLAGNAAIGGPNANGGRFDPQMINGGNNGYTLVKVGANQISPYGITNNLAALVISNGVWEQQGPIYGATTITVATNAGIFGIYTSQTFTNALTLNAATFRVDYGSNIWAGAITLNAGANTITVNNAGLGYLGVTGPVNGAGLLTKTGNYTLMLGGTDSYTGGTLISAGALEYNSAAAVTGIVTNNAVVAFNFAGIQNSLTNISAASYGSLGLTASNQNDLINFNAAGLSNTFLGVYYYGNMLTNNLANITPYINTGNAASNAWKLGGGGGILVITNNIAGSDSVTVGGTQMGTNGYSIVVLAGSNSYSGATTITNSQMLWDGSASNVNGANSNVLAGTSAIIFQGGSLAMSNATINAPIYSYNGTSSTGSGGLINPNGGQIMPIGGTTNYINGLISANVGFNIKSEAGTANSTGVTYITGGIIGTNVTVSLYSDAGTLNPFVITNNPINIGTNSTLYGHWDYFNVGSNNVGNLYVDWGGMMRLGVNNAFTNVPTLTFGQGNSSSADSLDWFDLNGYSMTVSYLWSTNYYTNASMQFVLNTNYITSATAATLTVSNGVGSNSLYNGYITGAVALVKSGAGTLVLNAPYNEYTNTTTVNGGILQVNQVGSLTNSAITVNTGALMLGATNTIGTNSLVINGAGALGVTNVMDQTFLNWATGRVTSLPAVALSQNDPNPLVFTNQLTNTFLGAAALTNVTYSGVATWADTSVRLGGGASTLAYTPAIGAGSNLIVGPLNGNAASVVQLLTSNSYDGGTLVQSGLLEISNNFNLGAAPGLFSATNITLNGGGLGIVSNSLTLGANRGITLGTNNGTLFADAGLTFYVTNAIAGAGSLTKSGAGTLVLSGADTYTNGTIITGGTLNVSNDAELGQSGGGLTFSNGSTLQVSGTWTSNNRAITLLSGGGVFTVDTNQIFTVTNSITGAGSLTKSGNGSMVLSASNSYTGGTLIKGLWNTYTNSSAQIQISNANALGTGGIVITNGGVLAISGGITVTNALTLFGGDAETAYAGALISSGSNIWGGLITVTGTSSRITSSSGNLRITNGITGNLGLNLAANSGSITIDTTPITLTQGVLFSGNGGSYVTTNYLNVSGNTFPSAQIWQYNTLVLGVTNALPTNVLLTVGTATGGGGILNLNGNNQTVGTLTSGTNLPNSYITNSSSTANTFTDNQSVTSAYNAVIGGNLALVKSGTGTLVLGGANSFSNGLTIAGGLLNISNDVALGAAGNGVAGGQGSLTFSNGGILQASGNMTLNNRAVTLQTGGGVVALDSSRTVTITNGINGAGGLTVSNISSVYNQTIGTLTLGGTNTFLGGITIDYGLVYFNSTNALPSYANAITLNGGIATNYNALANGGAVAVAGAYTNVAGWLNSGSIALGAGGALALTSNNSSNITWGAYSNLSLGAALGDTVTNSGTWTPVVNTYYVGGGGGTIVFTNNSMFTGANGLMVGNGGGGTVTLGGSNSYSGQTTVLTGSVLQVSNPYQLGQSSTIVLTNGGALVITGGSFNYTNQLIEFGGDYADSYQGPLRTIGGTSNTWSGAIIISNSQARIGAQGSSSILRITGGITGNTGICLNPGSATDVIIVDSLPINIGTQGVSMHGGGTNILAVSGNVFASDNVAYGNTLIVAAQNALPTNVALYMNNGSSDDAGSANIILGGFDQAVGNLQMRGYNQATPSIINVGTNTLTVNGNVTLGANIGNVSNDISRLQVTGAGALIINTNGGIVQVGNDTSTLSASTLGGNPTTNDMSTLGTFAASLGGTGKFIVGSQNVNTPGNAANTDNSLVKLATNSTITAGVLALGDGDTFGQAVNTLLLGAGTNTLNVNTVFVGSATSGRSAGVLQFNGSTGTLTISNATGGRADMYVMGGGTFASAGTGNALASTVNLTNHNSSLYLGNLFMAQDTTGNSSSNNLGSRTATFSFDTGTLNVSNIVMATRSSTWSTNAAGGYALATLNIGGGTSSIGHILMATNLMTGNSVTGIVNITGGLVTVSNGVDCGAGGTNSLAAINLAGGTLDMNGSAIGSNGANYAITLNLTTGTLQNVGQFNGGAALVMGSTGSVALAGNNTYSGQTIVSNGTLRLNSANALPGGIGTTGGTSQLVLAGGVVGLGAGSFTRATGTAGSNVQWVGSGGFAAFNGNQTVNIGGDSRTLVWNSTAGFVSNNYSLILGAATASNTVTWANGLDLNGATQTVQVIAGTGAAPADAIISGVITNSGATAAGLLKSGTGLLVLSATNGYNGGTIMAGGTLDVSNDFALGLGGSGLTFTNGGGLEISGTWTNSNRAVTLLSGGGIFNIDASQIYTLTNPISGTGALTKSGAGTLVLGAAASFTGNTTNNAGLLQLGAVNALYTNGALVVNSGTVDLNGNSQTIDLLGGLGGMVTNSGAGTPVLTLGNNNGSGTNSSVIGGSLSLTKVGGGTETLSNANTYTGGTFVKTGFVVIANSYALGSGPVSVSYTNGAGELQLTGGISVTNALTIGGDASPWSGPLYNLSGTNIWGGTITELSSSRIGMAAGLLRITNGITGPTGAQIVFNIAGGTLQIDTQPIILTNGTLIVNGTSNGTNLLAVGGNVFNTAVIGYAGNMTLGAQNALPTNSTVYMNMGTPDDSGNDTLLLNGNNQTIAGLIVRSSNTVSLNTINIGTNTLTINGNMTVGVNASNSVTRLNVTGAGSLIVTNNGGTIQIGNDSASNGGLGGDSATNNMSALGTFIASLGATGKFNIGDPNVNSAGGGAGASTVYLATNSTLTAGTLNIGEGDQYLVQQSLFLGAGANVLNVNTVNVGAVNSGRGLGLLQFNGATGSLALSNVTGDRVEMNVGSTGPNSQTAGTIQGLVNLAGHNSSLFLGDLWLGNAFVTAASPEGSRTGSFTFDTGLLDVTNIVMGLRSGYATNAAYVSTATLSIGGGTAHLGQILMATNGVGSGLANATLNLTGGALVTISNGVNRGLGGTGAAVINLAGATLDLNNSAIGAGGGANYAITLNASNGTLQNVSELNGGTTPLVKVGSGTLILSNNTYSGGTSNNVGILAVGGNNAFGSGALFMNGGALAVTNGGGWTATNTLGLLVNSIVDTTGGNLGLTGPTTAGSTNFVLTKNGLNTLTLGGVMGFSNLAITAGTVLNTNTLNVYGGYNIGAGVVISSNGVMTNSGVINIASGRLVLYQNGTLNNAGIITNTGIFSISEGAGGTGSTLVNNYAGGIINQYSGLNIGVYYTGVFNNAGGTLNMLNSDFNVGGGWAPGGVTNGNVGFLNINAGLVNFASSGAFRLGGNGDTNAAGYLNLNGGTLALNKQIVLGSGPGAQGFFNFNGGTLSGTVNNVTLLGPGLTAVTMQSNGAFIALGSGITNTISANVVDGGNGGGLTKNGAGVLVLSGNNTYTGGTTVSNGTLAVGASYAIPSNSTLYVDTLGVLDLNGNAATFSSINNSLGTITNSTSTGNMTLHFTSGTNWFFGTMSGAANFTLTGGGTLVMAGTNNFNTVITNASTLLVNGAQNGGVITVYTNSTVGGSGAISTLVVNGGVYSPGDAPATQTVANLTITNGGTLLMALGTNGYGQVVVTNSLSLANAQLQLSLSSFNTNALASSRIVLVDYSLAYTANGWGAYNTNQWFTLSDFGGPDNGMLMTNGSTYAVVGGGSQTNFFTINYDDIAGGGNAITLTVVPEPGTASMLGLMGVAFLVRRLSDRKRTPRSEG